MFGRSCGTGRGAGGLDNWHELPETAESELGPEQDIAAPVSEAEEGG